MTTHITRTISSRSAGALRLLAAALLLTGATQADAQGRSPHLSNDLKRHLDAGDQTTTRLVFIGDAKTADRLAVRHDLRMRRRLTSGTVFEVPAGRLAELADDPDVTQLSGDHVIRGQMAVTTVSIGADQAWSSDFGQGHNGITGKGVGVAVLDSGLTMVPELVGQVPARVDIINPNGDGRDEWGHGTHVAGIIAAAGSQAQNQTRGVAPGASIVSVKVLGADGSGHISDLIEGIDWVIANRKRYRSTSSTSRWAHRWNSRGVTIPCVRRLSGRGG